MTQVTATTLATFIDELASDLAEVSDRDQAFARRLTRALQAQSAHLRLPAVDALELVDVACTLHLTDRAKLVVTGRLGDGVGAVTIHWEESDFPQVALASQADPHDDPYLWCTLDLSVAGAKATLSQAVGGIPAGQAVEVLALATIGERTEYRIKALGLRRSAPPEALLFASD